MDNNNNNNKNNFNAKFWQLKYKRLPKIQETCRLCRLCLCRLCLCCLHTSHLYLTVAAFLPFRHLSDLNKILVNFSLAMLRSCLETIRDVIGDTVPDPMLERTIIECDFDCEKSLDKVLQGMAASRPLADVMTCVNCLLL